MSRAWWRGAEPHPGGSGRQAAGRETTGYVMGLGAGGVPVRLELPAAVSQHVLLVGATGSGKTTTVARLADGCLRAGMGIVLVDAKGGGLKEVALRLAEMFELSAVVVDPMDPDSRRYNPCRVGDAATVANTLVGAFEFADAAAIYREIAVETMSLVVAGLQALGRVVTVRLVRDSLGASPLDALAEAVKTADGGLASDLYRLAHSGAPYPAAWAGMSARLGALLQGTFGRLFEEDAKHPSLNLSEVMAKPSVTYVSLPAMAAQADVKLMARVLAQDVKVAAYRRLSESGAPALLVLDEFAALGDPEQVQDLLRQAREARISVVVSTQTLPQDPALCSAVLQSGCVIAHRLETENAQRMAATFWTRKANEVTRQIGGDPELPLSRSPLPRGESIRVGRPLAYGLGTRPWPSRCRYR